MKRINATEGIMILTLIVLIPIACVSLLASPLLTSLQDPKALLFQEVNQAMEQAKAVQAEVFSPRQFESGVKYYQEADEEYQKGKNLEDIRKKLKMATVYLLKSIETTKLFGNNFTDCVSARNDALSAEAPQYRKDEWEEAESALNQAAKTLEQGDLKGAQSRARKAEEFYRQVELESIKANYLDETQALLEEAKKTDVRKRAPYTLSLAQKLASKAETLLAENRYDTDEARQLAQEAKYEAQHAIYLSQRIKELESEKKTIETILLDAEKPIQKIGDEFDLSTRFHQGFDPPTTSVIQKIQHLQKEVASLEQDLSDKTEQLATLSEQVSKMESQLGDLKSKEASLTQLMEQQRQAREIFLRVEKSFTPEEAQIVRVGNQVIIRLYGLTFHVGKATIESQYFGLLSKVLKAIEEYPECGITVEGHTDSWGGDEANQRLSTKRAEAVREYLLATAGLDTSRVIAVGYGETKPVATNETKEGRRKNRRIDIVIHPQK